MALVDWIIVALLLLATLGGMAQGFIRAFCSLAGLIGGLAIAAWNYRYLSHYFLPIVKVQGVADTLGFIVIALVVMFAANLIGGMLAKTIRAMGLGCLDSLLGAVLGFLQGTVLVMISVLVTVAFFPHAHWMADATLPQYFFGAVHITTSVGPSDLEDRVRDGISTLEQEAPKLEREAPKILHPEKEKP